MFGDFVPLARPWWVNLLFFLPFIAFYFWRGKLDIPAKILAISAIFAAAFGFIEAAVVIYLRHVIGLSGSGNSHIPPAKLLYRLPNNIISIEILREFSTIIVLVCVVFLAVRSIRERWAIFFWTFAIWDIFYYIGLYFSIGWPPSLTSLDVLFLIPVPWYAQIWFPLLVSSLFVTSVLAGRK